MVAADKLERRIKWQNNIQDLPAARGMLNAPQFIACTERRTSSSSSMVSKVYPTITIEKGKGMTETPQNLSSLNEALVQAASEWHTTIVKGLIELGADVHWCQELPLRRAASHSDHETVKELRAHGADIGAAILAEAAAGNVMGVATLVGCAPETTVVYTLRKAMPQCPPRPNPTVDAMSPKRGPR